MWDHILQFKICSTVQLHSSWAWLTKNKTNTVSLCEIWCSPGGKGVFVGLFGYKAMWTSTKIPTFGRTYCVFRADNESSVFLWYTGIYLHVCMAVESRRPTSIWSITTLSNLKLYMWCETGFVSGLLLELSKLPQLVQKWQCQYCI
jgi:hypothetical protein